MRYKILTLIAIFSFNYRISYLQIIDESSLLVEEYELQFNKLNEPNSIEHKNQIDTLIFKKREKWRNPIKKDLSSADYYNNDLKKISYKLKNSNDTKKCSPSYDLIKNDIVIINGFCPINYFFCDTMNQNFIILSSLTLKNGPPYRKTIIIVNDYYTDWPSDCKSPRFYKNKLIFFQNNNIKLIDINSYNWSVDKAEILYQYRSSGKIIWEPYVNLTVIDTNWVLEYQNKVIINGIDIGKDNGYTNVFHYCIINNKPLYFYENNEEVYLSFNNKTINNKYDKVIHYNCCESSIFNAENNNQMIWFYALKNNKWYYVEAGIY